MGWSRLKYYSEDLTDVPLPKQTLYECVYAANKDYPDDYAFNYFGKRITYGTFFKNVDNAAKALVKLGVKPNDIVTIMGLSSPELFYCAYALSKIGAVINLISVLAGEKELVDYLEEAHSKVFVALDLFNEKVIAALPHTHVDTVVNISLAESMPLHIKTAFSLKAKVVKHSDFLSWKQFIKLSEGEPEVTAFKFTPNRFSYLAHTGGTTGTPKGVMIADEAMNGVVNEYSKIFIRERQDRFLNTIVPFVIYGFLINAHVPLALGFENYLLPKVESDKVPDILVENEINHLCTVPQYLEYLPRNKRFINADLSFLKNVGSGGDGMTTELESKINNILVKNNAVNKLECGYGTTEICATSCGNIVAFFDRSVGCPLTRNIYAAFSQETEEEMKYGEVGEICIYTPYLMLGYLNDIEATNEVVKVHKDGRRWFHTGDLGYVTEEGAVYISGRIKRIILTELDGMVSKIFPDRIEKLLDSHKPVEVSCVVKSSGDAPTVKLKAYVVLKEKYRSDSDSIETELREMCRAELPQYSLPSEYEFIDKMPLTASGKIDFRTLEKIAEGKGE